MLAEGEYCCDILTQVAACRAALDQVGAELAASHVKSCILGDGDSKHERAGALTQEELLDELKVTLSRLMK